MGITGLLPLFKSIQTPTHVKYYEGKTLAVDAYVWLHRGAYRCAEALALGHDSENKYIEYVFQLINMLRYHGVTPFLVFDGAKLPSKQVTEEEREQRRASALELAKDYKAKGLHKQARDQFARAVDVTPHMAHQLIQVLKQHGVRYVVAPYEADAQLAYLEKEGIVDGIITEDSDLLVFGCRTVLFKLDSSGSCVEICSDRFGSCREFNFVGWTLAEFRQMAILSGCDYARSIPRLGLKTAYRLIHQHRCAKKAIQRIRIEGQLSVPKNYDAEFSRAELTFLHQRVYDPNKKLLTRLNPLEPDLLESLGVSDDSDYFDFAGPVISEAIIHGVASGDVDPETKQKICAPKVPCTPISIKSQRFVKTRHNTPSEGQKTIQSFFSKSINKINTPNKTVTRPTSEKKSRQPLATIPSNNNRVSCLKTVQPEPESPLGMTSKFFTTKSKNTTSTPTSTSISTSTYTSIPTPTSSTSTSTESIKQDIGTRPFSDSEDITPIDDDEDFENISSNDDSSPVKSRKTTNDDVFQNNDDQIVDQKHIDKKRKLTPSSQEEIVGTSDSNDDHNDHRCSTPPITSDIEVSSPPEQNLDNNTANGNSKTVNTYHKRKLEFVKHEQGQQEREQEGKSSIWSHVLVMDNSPQTPSSLKHQQQPNTATAPKRMYTPLSSFKVSTKRNQECDDELESFNSVSDSLRKRFTHGIRTPRTSLNNNNTKEKVPVNQTNYQTPTQRLTAISSEPNVKSNNTPTRPVTKSKSINDFKITETPLKKSSLSSNNTHRSCITATPNYSISSKSIHDQDQDTKSTNNYDESTCTTPTALERFRFRKPISS